MRRASEMPRRRDLGVPAPVFMLHQLASIELNAINLALDTVARFSSLSLPWVRSSPSSTLGR